MARRALGPKGWWEGPSSPPPLVVPQASSVRHARLPVDGGNTVPSEDVVLIRGTGLGQALLPSQ